MPTSRCDSAAPSDRRTAVGTGRLGGRDERPAGGGRLPDRAVGRAARLRPPTQPAGQATPSSVNRRMSACVCACTAAVFSGDLSILWGHFGPKPALGPLLFLRTATSMEVL